MDLLPTVQRLFVNPAVVYQCDCGARRPLTLTYFCRYCLQLRCRGCVSKEVDSQYCQHCLEYIPLMDGKLKKNKCATCFQCPSCLHTLSTRSFLEQVPAAEGSDQPLITKKAFTLVCCFCKWSSLDVGIPKQFVASGNWPELTPPNTEIIDKRFEYYKFVWQKDKADRDKVEREKCRNRRPVNVIDLLSRYSISPVLSPKVNECLRSKMLMSRVTSSDSQLLAKQTESAPSQSTDDIKPLDLSFWFNQAGTTPTDLSSLEQRLQQIESQPKLVEHFFPISKTLSVKRSLRCRKCEHNLIKSECNPCVIRLKIQLSAYYHVPEIKLQEIPKDINGENWTDVIITIKNPTSYKMRVQLFDDENKLSQKLNENEIFLNVQYPTKELILFPKDETLDLGIEQNESIEVDDDPCVVYRHSNKIGVKLSVKSDTNFDANKLIPIICFKLRHDHVTTIVDSQSSSSSIGGNKDFKISFIEHTVYLNVDNQNIST